MHVDLREIGPTYYFAPPRVFETQLTNVMIRMEDAGTVQEMRMFDYLHGPCSHHSWPRHSGWQEMSAIYGTGSNINLGEAFVYGPLKNTLGFSSCARRLYSGRGDWPGNLSISIDLWGLILSSFMVRQKRPCSSPRNLMGEVRSDTVGVTCPGVELKIAENGEVFYRSPGVFVEYYKNPESTADTKDAEGWVATGDAGFHRTRRHRPSAHH